MTHRPSGHCDMMTLIIVRQHVEHQGSVILAEGRRPRVDTHTRARTHSDRQVAERREGDEMWSTFKTNAPFARGGICHTLPTKQQWCLHTNTLQTQRLRDVGNNKFVLKIYIIIII